MKKAFKKLVVLVLTVSMVLSMVGCSKGGESTTETKSNDAGTATTDTANSASGESTEATTEAGTEKTQYDTTITVMVFDRSNAPDGEGTATDNRWTKWLNEQMAEYGITVEYIAVARSEELNKVNTMMASGTAADIMLCYTGSTVQGFFNDGGTYDLSEYLEGDKFAQLKEYLGEEVLKVGTNVDGEVWSVPARRATSARTNLNIRKDWLDKLGMAVPTTTDELYTVLKAFKEKDPGGVGSENVIAASAFTDGAAGPLALSFLKSVSDPTQYAINYCSWIYSDEGFADYMRFLNKLYNEGLMDSEYYAHADFAQTQKEYFVNGTFGFWEYDVSGNVDTLRGGLLQNLKQNIPDAEFVSMPPLKNVNDGLVYNNAYPVNGAYVFIPKTAKNPEACMEYLNFLAGNGGFTVFHGFEGEHFDYDNGVPVVKDAEYNAKTKDWTRHDLFLVGNQGYYTTEEDFMDATSKELPGWEQYVLDNYNNAIVGTRLYEPTFSAPTMVEQSANIQITNETYAVKTITCAPEEFDSIVAEWKAELQKYGLDDIIAERTEYYNSIK